MDAHHKIVHFAAAPTGWRAAQWSLDANGKREGIFVAPLGGWAVIEDQWEKQWVVPVVPNGNDCGLMDIDLLVDEDWICIPPGTHDDDVKLLIKGQFPDGYVLDL